MTARITWQERGPRLALLFYFIISKFKSVDSCDRLTLSKCPPKTDDLLIRSISTAQTKKRFDLGFLGNLVERDITPLFCFRSVEPRSSKADNNFMESESPNKLTPKQCEFVRQYYLVDLNATRAAVRDGYSKKTANQQDPRLLVHVGIQEAIQKYREELTQNGEIATPEEILKGDTCDIRFDPCKLYNENGVIKVFMSLTMTQREANTSIESRRRIATVMFADISGFTPMSEKMDPEQAICTMSHWLSQSIDYFS